MPPSITEAVAELKADPRKVYVAGVFLGFAAGIVVGARLSASKRKPCPCDGQPAPGPLSYFGGQPPPGPWSTIPPEGPFLRPPHNPGANVGAPRSAPAAPSTRPAPSGPTIAEPAPDFIQPAGPADVGPDPSLTDAFRRFHMGDNGAYENLG